MNVEQLTSILQEYPMSMRLVVTTQRQPMLETTVVEMLIKLTPEPQSALVSFCGRDQCIIRERNDSANNFAGTLIIKKWLEMDMR